MLDPTIIIIIAILNAARNKTIAMEINRQKIIMYEKIIAPSLNLLIIFY